jgi:hypothetical protein
MPKEVKGVGKIVAGVVNPPLLGKVEKLYALGYTDTEIVRQGIRLLAKKEGVPA